MKSANSKSCPFLPKAPHRCQINLHFFSPDATRSSGAVSACLFTNQRIRSRTSRIHPRHPARRRLSQPPRARKQPMTIDRFCRCSFKSLPTYGAGMITAWPICRRRGSSFGLAAISASNLTPYLRAIRLGVSPALTACVRGVTAATAVARPGLATPADPAPLGAVGPGPDGRAGRTALDAVPG